MKLNVEVMGMEQGTMDGGRRWVRLWGRHQRGTYGRHLLYGQTAEAFCRELTRMLGEGEDVSTARMIVSLTGEWREDTSTERKYRNFQVDSFAILSGPALEIARLRRTASDVLKAAEQHRAEGRLGHAYKAVLEFIASVSGRPVDLSEVELEIAAEDEKEFGLTEDPEAAAAARYAAMDMPPAVEKLEVAPDVLDDAPSDPEDQADPVSAETIEMENGDVSPPVEEPLKASGEVRDTAVEVAPRPAPVPQASRPVPGIPSGAPVSASVSSVAAPLRRPPPLRRPGM